MRYVMFMMPAEHAAESAEAIEAMMKYNAALAEAGVLESLTGLHDPELGVRVRFDSGVARGAQVPQNGAIGACWVLEVRSHEEAVDWAYRCPGQPGDVIELRRIQEIEESPLDGSVA
jgi:hypothetical protein